SRAVEARLLSRLTRTAVRHACVLPSGVDEHARTSTRAACSTPCVRAPRAALAREDQACAEDRLAPRSSRRTSCAQPRCQLRDLASPISSALRSGREANAPRGKGVPQWTSKNANQYGLRAAWPLRRSVSSVPGRVLRPISPPRPEWPQG